MYTYTVPIIAGLLTVGLFAYTYLAVSMCGYPHKCPIHGWCAQAICFECDAEQDEGDRF